MIKGLQNVLLHDKPIPKYVQSKQSCVSGIIHTLYQIG